MTSPARRHALRFAAAASLALVLAAPAAVSAQQAATATGTRTRAVFQVSDDAPAKWNLVLNNVGNAAAELGAQPGELEIVVFGPGIGMLKAGSPVAPRLAEALKAGVKIVACQNTMRALQLTAADMAPDIGYVPSGVTELITKQREGWAYIRP